MPTLTEDINTTLQAAVNKINDLIATGDIKDLTFAAKALEAIRGTAELQNIIAQSASTLTALGAALTAATGDLTAAKNTHVSTLNATKSSIIADLNTLADTLEAAFNAEAATTGTPRVGDIWLALYPDPGVLPSKVSICDGRYVPLAEADALIAAWGIGVGGTPVPFVVNYNASVGSGLDIILDGTGVRLPDLTGRFFKANETSELGTFEEDMVGPHNHASPNPFVTSATGSGSGVTPSGAQSFQLGTVSTTADNSGTETRPKNISALPVIRYK